MISKIDWTEKVSVHREANSWFVDMFPLCSSVSIYTRYVDICLAEGLVNFSPNDVVIYSENYEHEQPGPGGGRAEAEQVHGGL